MLSVIFLRFIIGGFVVAFVPVVGKAAGPRLGGMVMLVPAITVLSLYYIGQARGNKAIVAGALGGLWGLIPLAVFLVALAIMGQRLPALLTFAISLIIWAIGVLAVRLVQS